ncbi:FAD-dependent oxidoreductase [Methanohalobium sp.]|uniref:FAD-dependent oxidoreductase n=1 Tax=Methanohalobium sp. TaxID=2837493 RepID=UPI0025E90A1E|nr:FAD-dependent oxidoreductase [Methanohalobium sp.]
MIYHDVIVIGGGLSGLRAALEAHKKGADVAIISKVSPIRSHSVAAQGGINASLGADDSWKAHAWDTVKGSDYLADQDAVEILCKEAPEIVLEMDNWGTSFSRTQDGKIAQRPFGGAGFPRTCYAGDKTGHNLLYTLQEQVLKAGIKVYPEWMVTRLVTDGGRCTGFVAINIFNSEPDVFKAKITVIATGGYGRIYKRSTNSIINRGFGIGLAYRAGVPLQDMEFVQFHPTTLWDSNILITEGVRGEGGYLYNKNHQRFMKSYAPESIELAPRDIVARAIQTEINEGRGISNEYVYLDITHLDPQLIKERLSGIREISMDFAGVDPVKKPIPVQPGQHYSMGGILSSINGKTPMDGLYAVGECACISVHGANRLGGNSLLDTLVFGKRAGQHAAESIQDKDIPQDENLIKELENEKRFLSDLFGESGENFATVRNELKNIMQEKVGVFRNHENLEHAIEDLKNLKYRAQKIKVKSRAKSFNLELLDAIELKRMVDIAHVIATGALARQESRGAHYRTDFIERDDNNWKKHTIAYYTPQGPRLEYKDVTITSFYSEKREY